MSESFSLNLFEDPQAAQEMLKGEAKRERSLYEGDGKHFVVAWIGDSGMETEFVCEWPEDDDKAPCHDPGVIDGCKIKYSWENLGVEMLEKNNDESQLLKVKFPIGYRTEGWGEDFEDWVYSVRPNGEEAST